MQHCPNWHSSSRARWALGQWTVIQSIHSLAFFRATHTPSTQCHPICFKVPLPCLNQEQDSNSKKMETLSCLTSCLCEFLRTLLLEKFIWLKEKRWDVIKCGVGISKLKLLYFLFPQQRPSINRSLTLKIGGLVTSLCSLLLWTLPCQSYLFEKEPWKSFLIKASQQYFCLCWFNSFFPCPLLLWDLYFGFKVENHHARPIYFFSIATLTTCGLGIVFYFPGCFIYISWSQIFMESLIGMPILKFILYLICWLLHNILKFIWLLSNHKCNRKLLDIQKMDLEIAGRKRGGQAGREGKRKTLTFTEIKSLLPSWSAHSICTGAKNTNRSPFTIYLNI